MKLRVWLAVGLVCSLAQVVAWGQKPAEKAPAKAGEKAAEKAPAKAAEKPAEKPTEKPAEEAATDKPAAKGPAGKAFAAKLDEWKTILKEMRKVRSQYQAATDADRPALQKQWEEMIAKGNAVVPTLRDLAGKAYAEAPNEDLDLLRFVGKVLFDEAQHDNYDSALELAKLLKENDGFDKKYSLPGDAVAAAAAAAFANEEYDLAEEWFTLARDSGAKFPEEWKMMANSIPEYKKLWEVEKAIREKEAAANDLPRVKFTTSKGTIVLELFENEAPETVANFISLVDKKFYDGLSFHRVINHFMAQGGCPKGDGTGDPGYKIYCEVAMPEHKDDYRKHFRGTLSMAHAGKDTGGSQFFITFQPTPQLNGRHTAFGRVVEGMDVLAKLNRREPPRLPGDNSAAPDTILKAEVVRKRDHAYAPRKVD